MDMDQGLQLSDLKGIIRRRAWLVGAIAGAAVLLSIFISAVIPNEYEATNTLLVEPQSISPQLVESGVPETDINDRLHLIQMQILSRSRLRTVITELAVYPDLEDEMTSEELIEYMRDKIDVAPLLPDLAMQARAQSGVRVADVAVNTFLLSFRHESAEMAANVANRLASDFIGEHIRERVQVSGDTSEFIDAELDRLTRQIAAVEKQIAGVKSANSGRLPEDFAASQRLYERTLTALRDVEREYTIARSDAAFYGQQAVSGGLDPGANRAFITPSRRLDILEVQLGEFRARGFTDKHPDIISTLDEITRIRAEMDGSGDPENGEAEYTPSQMNARAEQRRAQLRADASQHEMKQIRSQIAELEARMAATPAVAEQLGALEREHEALLESFGDYSNKRLEASVAAQMESRQKGEKFRVLEAAYPPPEPTSPNRPLILALGLMMGLGLGVAAALLAEVSDDSFHDTRSLQSKLSLPVLAGIPQVVLPSDRAAMRGRTIKRLIAAGGIAAAVLLASAGGYWLVNGGGAAPFVAAAQATQN